LGIFGSAALGVSDGALDFFFLGISTPVGHDMPRTRKFRQALVLPSIWVAALTWAGIYAGNVLQGLTQGTRDVSQAGAQGSGAITRNATGQRR